MNLLPFVAFLLFASCSAAPSKSSSPTNLVVAKNHFLNDFILYTGKHDIVNIFVPLNQFNFEEQEMTPSSSSSEETVHPVIFFVEADLENGQRTDKGLYVYKNNKATKLLDNGRDAVATHENVTYFGAQDGIYMYNEAENKAVKVGTVTDNIIQLAYNNKTDAIYYLTENRKLFKLNKEATASAEVANVKDAQKVVFGFDGNMYYYGSDNNVYILDTEVEGSVPRKVEDLPSCFKKLVLESPIYGFEADALLVVDDSLYFVQPNATVYKSPVRFAIRPTAFAPQPTLIQFYAYEKKIYELNVVYVMFNSVLEELNAFLEDNKIQPITNINTT